MSWVPERVAGQGQHPPHVQGAGLDVALPAAIRFLAQGLHREPAALPGCDHLGCLAGDVLANLRRAAAPGKQLGLGPWQGQPAQAEGQATAGPVFRQRVPGTGQTLDLLRSRPAPPARGRVQERRFQREGLQPAGVQQLAQDRERFVRQDQQAGLRRDGRIGTAGLDPHLAGLGHLRRRVVPGHRVEGPHPAV